MSKIIRGGDATTPGRPVEFYDAAVRTLAVGVLEIIRYVAALALLGFIAWALLNGFNSGDIGGALVRSALAIGAFLVLAVLYSLGMTWARGEPFIVRQDPGATDRGDESSGALSSTAKETLTITRRLASGDASAEVPREAIVRSALSSAGHEDVSDREIDICLWPDRTALRVAEGFFGADRPLARLRLEHVRTKWAAAGAYNAVKTALLIGMAEHVTPEQHALAVAWNAEIGGEGFRATYPAAQDDIAEMRGRAGADPVSTYAAGIYLRSILREDCLDRYFPADADAERAVAEARTQINAAIAELRVA